MEELIKEYFLKNLEEIKNGARQSCINYIFNTDSKEMLAKGVLTAKDILMKQINYDLIYYDILKSKIDEKQAHTKIKEIYKKEILPLLQDDEKVIQKELDKIKLPQYTIDELIESEKQNFICEKTIDYIRSKYTRHIFDAYNKILDKVKKDKNYLQYIKDNINDLYDIIIDETEKNINLNQLYNNTVKKYIKQYYLEETDIDFHKEFEICLNQAIKDHLLNKHAKAFLYGIKEIIDNVNETLSSIAVGKSFSYDGNLWESIKYRKGAFTIINDYYASGPKTHHELIVDITKEHPELIECEEKESDISDSALLRDYGKSEGPMTNEDLDEKELKNTGEHYLHLAFGYIVEENNKTFAIIDRAGLQNYKLNDVINILDTKGFDGIFSANETLNKLLTRVR